jgi:PAS domain S-box-containing protein
MAKSKFRWWSKPPATVRYGVAALAVVTALATGSFLSTTFASAPFVSLFICAVMLAAWFGGLGPGLFATAFSTIAFEYFLIPPLNTFALVLKDGPRLLLYAVAALFVALLTAAQRRTAESLRRSRDELQGAVEELEDLNNALQAESAERKRADQRIREAEKELQETIDTVPALIGTYQSDGSSDFVNRTWRTYLGYAVDNKKDPLSSPAVHPDDVAAIESKWRAHLTTGEPFQAEQRLRRADGQYRWHLIRRVPLRDEHGNVVKWYGVGSDIEDQKLAEGRLRRSEAYSAEAQRLSRTGSFGWNIASGDIVWSKQTYRILGVERSVTPTVDVLLARVHPDDRDLVSREIERAVGGKPVSDYEHRLLMPNGSVKHLHVRAHRVKYESGDEEIVGALVDITESKKAQDALHAAQAELAHVTRLTALGEMSASIAHEVNQPLAAIVTNGEASLRWLARDVPDVGEALEATRRIVDEANRAGSVIRTIRDLSKKKSSEMVPIDIGRVIEEIVALLQIEAMNHRVSVTLTLSPDLPLVLADRIQLQQVILNLAMNGIQGMDAVTDRPRALAIRTSLYGSDHVIVAVEDVGVGIEAADLNRLFKPFFTTKPQGMGMGLSICRSIIEAHGGRVWASRNAGHGMTFQFTIPAHRPAAGSAG